MLVALTPRAGAQGEQSCFSGSGKEISFENEASFIVDFAIFNPDGTSMTPWLPVLPDEHENGCDVSIGLKSGPVECTRSCQDGNDPGTDCGDTPSEWGGYLCLIPDQLITLGFRANVPGEGWEYHFFAHTWNPSLSEFYTPFTVPSYPTNQDTHFRYYEGKGERRMLTSIQLLASPLQFIEDFIGDTWVLPYNLDYVCAQPGADCSHPYTDWNVFVTPVEGVEKLEGEEDPPSFPPYTFAAESDVVVPTNYTWDWDVSGLELRFPSGQRLTVEGDLTADGVTFTEADEGQGWGGIDVLGTGADLDLENGAVVEHAATGVTVFDGATASIANSTLRDNGTGLDVRSSAGTTVSGSTIRHNTTGIRADIVQEEPGAPVACFGPCLRSDLDVFDSVIRNNSGVGLAAYFADVEVRDTEIRDNSSYGIYASSTTMNPFTGNLVVSNGSTGALAGTGADLFLSPTSAIGENRIASNTTSEVAVAQGGFAFLGDDTGLTGDNAVFDPAFDPSSGFRLVKNDSKTLVDANFVYWGQSGGPPQGAFTGSVDGALALACDPIYPPAPDDPNPCAASRTASLVEIPDGTATRSQGLGARIRALRAQLAAAPDTPGADTLVYRLGGLHRLDGDDTLGEWAQTRALLAALRGALVVPELPAGARAVGEASLEVEAVRLLQRSEVTRATGLLQTWGEHVSSAEVRQTLTLVAAALYSRTGDYAEAAALAEAAAAEEDDEEMRQSVETLAAHYAMRAAEAGGRGADPVQPGRHGEASARAGAQASLRADVNLAVYPNPVSASAMQSTVAVALAERADVHLAVYDVLGRRVAVLHSGALAPGAHRFGLDARALPAGVYVVRAEVGGSRSTTQTLTERMTVVR